MRLKWLYSILFLSLPGPLQAFDPELDSVMYHNPELLRPRVVPVLPAGATSLWLKALERPELELRCRAADTISQAHEIGLKGLEVTLAPLRAALDQTDQDPAVRLAAAHALVVIDAREAAPSLLQQAQAAGGDLANLVEPALARWDYRPARQVWLDRLKEPATPQRSLVLAIRGLGAVREAQAADRLRELVLSNRTAAAVRQEAAHALARLRTEGLEVDAEHLASDFSARGLVARLAAAALMHEHKSAAAIRLLQRLAEHDPEPAVSGIAVARLLAIDPKLAVPALEHLLISPDIQLRAYGVEVLRRQPSEKHIRLLGERLDDQDPHVRADARRALHELAAHKELRAAVIATAMQVLEKESWRCLEQAAILLAQLDHKPAAPRLLELLTFNQPEVCVSAAWGLRKLAVPNTLSSILRYVQEQLPPLQSGSHALDRPEVRNDILDHQLSQLVQLLGLLKYRQADEMLHTLIPHRGPWTGPETRAAAVWALGWIHQGESVPQLTSLLLARFRDVSSQPPEDGRVRLMCAITFGRLKAPEAENDMRGGNRAHTLSRDPITNACGWAIEQMTGKPLKDPKTIEERQLQSTWLLIPLNPAAAKSVEKPDTAPSRPGGE
jgi:HEAT repeat protein